MKIRLLGGLLPCVLLLSGQGWQAALPSYQFQFPRDHFSHPDYQTEWWYYTGNVRAANGRRFGFELTFFRQATTAPAQRVKSESPWNPDQVYLAHLAFSDIDGGQFFHTERLNRAGPGLAGANIHEARYWNGNWQVRWTDVAAGKQELQAVADGLTLNFRLTPEKPFVINGQNGVSQKGPEPGEASHYISFSRLGVSGNVQWKGASYAVTGLAWMDHEFFTEPADGTLQGWDWFAIQLNNNKELMLYRLRRKSGGPDRYSSGTYIDARGQVHFLDWTQFALSPGETWSSPDSHAKYPLAWKIVVPSLQLELEQKTGLQKQELFSTNRVTAPYWEGAVTFSGQMRAKPVEGVGYLEMTGYSEAVNLRQR